MMIGWRHGIVQWIRRGAGVRGGRRGGGGAGGGGGGGGGRGEECSTGGVVMMVVMMVMMVFRGSSASEANTNSPVKAREGDKTGGARPSLLAVTSHANKQLKAGGHSDLSMAWHGMTAWQGRRGRLCRRAAGVAVTAPTPSPPSSATRKSIKRRTAQQCPR
ncbi:hypothetical protein E2C01_049068 [Portunus trituberculatus]|uniref:Uncharacterized protein n=1 Tax=Portunus trituberculatus TaxID=210409 RepID=A0A5B7GCU5_PORTR|nr:hypothetical protein [Portunus trituberculatus]